MPLETATYISDFVTSNPAASDGMNNADDHMRLIKSALKNTFPSVTGAMTRGPLTGGGYGLLTDQGSAAAPAYSFLGAPTMGFYALDFTNTVMGFSGTLRGNGMCPAGSIMDFGGTTAPPGWIICDGTAVSRTLFSELFAYIGTTWGAGDGSTTFNVPSLQDRFRRHRRAGGGALAGPVGTLQSPVNLTHTHGVVGTSQNANADHTHPVNLTTGGMLSNATHAHTTDRAVWNGGTTPNGAGAGGTVLAGATSTATSTVNTDHLHNVNGNTDLQSATHAHDINFASGASGDANESRPYSATVLTCIKA